MSEFKIREMSEIQTPQAEKCKEIKPENGMKHSESQKYWGDKFSNSEKETLKEGGRYGELKNYSDGSKKEVHHMPADSASLLETKDGPAIIMDKEDHRKTASCGSSAEAREYRALQKEKIEQGDFRGALQMDIDDIKEQFGDKYDKAINQMLQYVEKLESEGKI